MTCVEKTTQYPTFYQFLFSMTLQNEYTIHEGVYTL